MKTSIRYWMTTIVLLSCVGLAFAATPPERINFQGVLRDSTGAPVTGTHAMAFDLYDSDGGPGCTTGMFLLGDTQAAVTVSTGLFSVALGDGTIVPGTASTLGQAFRDNAEVWVEIHVEGETLCPRVRVESAAYAQLAGGLHNVTVDGAGNVGIGTTNPGWPLEIAADTGGQRTVNLTGTNNPGIFFNDTEESSSWSIFHSDDDALKFRDVSSALTRMVISGSNGNVGIGAGAPGAKLDVVGTTELNGAVTITGTNTLYVGGEMTTGGDLIIGDDLLVSDELFVEDDIEMLNGDLVFKDGSRLMSARPDPPCFDNSNRFADCGNGTVTDGVTGLIWLKDAACLGLADWATANELAAALGHGTHPACNLTDGSSPGDWRLPTLACPPPDNEYECDFSEATGEFDSISSTACPGSSNYIRDTQGQGCWSEGDPFSGVQSSLYWSATTNAISPNGAWNANLNSGNVVTHLKTNVNFVWPVRGGP